MRKQPLNISLIITIAGILLSIGGSWGVIQLKAQDVDKLKDKTEIAERKIAVLETNIEYIKESSKEQKENTEKILQLLLKHR